MGYCQREVKMPPISLGISSCPNDTFIFHALINGLVLPEYHQEIFFDLHMADVEELNNLAHKKSLMVTKISVGALPLILEDYCLLSSGAALGWGCGPLVVARKGLGAREIKNGVIAIPGKMTTANMLLDLCGKFEGPRKEMLFSDIMPAIARGEADLGVIIHEGRFIWAEHNLDKLVDLGQWWEENYHLPLPLGAIAIRRDVPPDLAHAIEKAISSSLAYARSNPGASRQYIRSKAQEIDDRIINAHIETFVTEYSLDLGDVGRHAIETLTGAYKNPQGAKTGKSLFLR